MVQISFSVFAMSVLGGLLASRAFIEISRDPGNFLLPEIPGLWLRDPETATTLKNALLEHIRHKIDILKSPYFVCCIEKTNNSTIAVWVPLKIL